MDKKIEQQIKILREAGQDEAADLLQKTEHDAQEARRLARNELAVAYRQRRKELYGTTYTEAIKRGAAKWRETNKEKHREYMREYMREYRKRKQQSASQ